MPLWRGQTETVEARCSCQLSRRAQDGCQSTYIRPLLHTYPVSSFEGPSYCTNRPRERCTIDRRACQTDGPHPFSGYSLPRQQAKPANTWREREKFVPICISRCPPGGPAPPSASRAGLPETWRFPRTARARRCVAHAPPRGTSRSRRFAAARRSARLVGQR